MNQENAAREAAIADKAQQEKDDQLALGKELAFGILDSMGSKDNKSNNLMTTIINPIINNAISNNLNENLYGNLDNNVAAYGGRQYNKFGLGGPEWIQVYRKGRNGRYEHMYIRATRNNGSFYPYDFNTNTGYTTGYSKPSLNSSKWNVSYADMQNYYYDPTTVPGYQAPSTNNATVQKPVQQKPAASTSQKPPQLPPKKEILNSTNNVADEKPTFTREEVLKSMMSPEELKEYEYQKMRFVRGLDAPVVDGIQQNTLQPQWIVDQNADKYVAATEFKPWHLFTVPMKGLDLLAPSRWVGLMDDDNDMGFAYLYSDRNPGFFVGNDPTKPFSKRFAQEHPNIAAGTNFVGDLATGYGAAKTLVAVGNATKPLASPTTYRNFWIAAKPGGTFWMNPANQRNMIRFGEGMLLGEASNWAARNAGYRDYGDATASGIESLTGWRPNETVMNLTNPFYLGRDMPAVLKGTTEAVANTAGDYLFGKNAYNYMKYNAKNIANAAKDLASTTKDIANSYTDAFKTNWADQTAREDMKNGLKDAWTLLRKSTKDGTSGRTYGAYKTTGYPDDTAKMFAYNEENPGVAKINLGGDKMRLEDLDPWKKGTMGHYYKSDGTVVSGTQEELLEAGVSPKEFVYTNPDKEAVGRFYNDIDNLPKGVAVTGDSNSPTLGQQLIKDIRDRKYLDALYHFTHNTGEFSPTEVVPRGGIRMSVGAENSTQSPAALSALYRRYLTNPEKFNLRYSVHPAGNFNNYVTDTLNRPIYEMEQAMLKGEVTPEEYSKALIEWMEGIERKFNVNGLPQEQLMRRPELIFDENGKIVGVKKWQPWLISKTDKTPAIITSTAQTATNTPLYSSLLPSGGMADKESKGLIDLANEWAQKISDAYNMGKASFNNWNKARQLSRAINKDVRNARLSVGEPTGGAISRYTPTTQEPPAISWENATSSNNNMGNSSLFQRDDLGMNDVRYLENDETVGQGLLEETMNASELGKKDFFGDLNSPEYRQKWLNQGVPEEVTDAVLEDMRSLAKEPIDFSKTAEELDAAGHNVRRKGVEINMGDGTKIINKDTGSDVSVASDLGEDARYTTIHEELHHTTNNSEGYPLNTPDPDRYNYDKFMEPVEITDNDGNKIIFPTKRYQNYMMDQNENLLPTRDPMYTLAIDYPETAEKELLSQGFTSDAAKLEVKKMRHEVGDLWSIQEQRSYLKTWFNKYIRPHLKNKRNAAEIEQYINEHKSLINMDKNVKLIMTKLRPGSIKEYAKYFAESLALLPAVNTRTNNTPNQDQ